MKEGDKMDKDFEIWQQERGFWIPRLTLILATNSILFLGYVAIRDILFGGVVAIIAIIANILYFVFFADFAKTLDNLQKRIESKLPIEYKKRRLTGRWGFAPMIIIFELLWVVSAFHSFLGWFQ